MKLGEILQGNMLQSGRANSISVEASDRKWNQKNVEIERKVLYWMFPLLYQKIVDDKE